MSLLLAGLAGLVTGVISAWGVGGGTLLVLYMALFTNLPQQVSQGVNLLYFLPVSAAALISHLKNGLIVKRAVIPAAIAGVPAAVIGAYFATVIEADILRKGFGVFILAIGVLELFKPKTNNKR